jgi:hypothetical protein
MVEDKPIPEEPEAEPESLPQRSSEESPKITLTGLVVLPVKHQKRRRYNLARLFQQTSGSGDRAESSAAGAARAALRNVYQQTAGATSEISAGDFRLLKDRLSLLRNRNLQKAKIPESLQPSLDVPVESVLSAKPSEAPKDTVPFDPTPVVLV